MATLKTMSWKTTPDGEKACCEIIIPMDNIIFAQQHDDGMGDTCIIALTEHRAVHVDIPFKQMRTILDHHQRFPNQNFDTHPEPDLSWLGRSANRKTVPLAPPPRPQDAPKNSYPSNPLGKYRKKGE